MRWGVALIVVLALAIPGVIAPGISAVGCFNVACSCFSDSICPADYGADCKSNGGLGDADCAGVQSCAVTTGCGYGGIEPGLGEVCDDGIGINGQPGSCCTTSCQFSAASTQCRAASGVCDAAEFCPGTSNSCPANGFLSAANSCAVPSTWSCVNQCTRQGSPTLCPGNGATCTGAAGSPVQEVALPNWECSGGVFVAAPGQCVVPPTTGCGYGGRESGLGEACDEGIANNGQAWSCCDSSCQYKSAASQCRGASGVCDVAEFCSGSSGACTADSFLPSTTVCSTGSWSCDAGAPSCSRSRTILSCPGSSGACGTASTNTDPAPVNSQCSAGNFVAGTCGAIFCGDNIKNGAEICDGTDLDGKATCAAAGLIGPGPIGCVPSPSIDQCTFSGCYCANGNPSCTDPDCAPGSYKTNGACCLIGEIYTAGSCQVITENTIALCNNGVNDDTDGLIDRADDNPGWLAGESCNVCYDTLCPGINAANVPKAWRTNGPSPMVAGTIFTSATALRPGPATLRHDWDGINNPGTCWCAQCDSANGYTWDVPTGACVPSVDPPCALTSVAITNFDPIVTKSDDPGRIDVGVAYTITSPSVTQVTVDYDTDGNTATWEQSNVFTETGAQTDSILMTSLPAGSYSLTARVTAKCFGSSKSVQSATISRTITPPSNPSISAFDARAYKRDRSSLVQFGIDFTHTADSIVTLEFGESTLYGGVPATQAGPTGFTSGPQTFNPETTYISILAGTSRSVTAIVTIVDRVNPLIKTVQSKVFTIASLDEVVCIPPALNCPPPPPEPPTGDPTCPSCLPPPPPPPPPPPFQCAAGHCKTLDSLGNEVCVVNNACFPTTKTICIAPTMEDRDYSKAACENGNTAPTSFCVNYKWADVNHATWPAAACCGDDVNENVPGITFPAAQNVCCQSAGMCYTTAGRDAARQNICVAPESPESSCLDGIDNDCDGKYDEFDSDCGARSITGTVKLSTPSGEKIAPDAAVTVLGYTALATRQSVGSNDLITKYSFVASTTSVPNIVLMPGPQTIAASYFGYRTQIKTVNLVKDGDAVVDFLLEPRLCNDDCTNNDGYCDRSCIGVGLCQPDQNQKRTIEACHPAGAAFGLKKGQEVIVSTLPAQTGATPEVEVGLCCANIPVIKKAPKTAVAEAALSKIDTLVKYCTTVVLNGKPYKFCVNSW